SGVGKSTLINRIFGVSTANVAKDKPGEADIEQEFTSPENDRLILHDSKGFEAGDAGNYETVKSFIVKRKKEPKIKDQLHAVWLCLQIPIPTYGERLLEDAAEAFLKIRKEVLGNSEQLYSGQRYLQEECVQLIQDFTGENIAHVAVSGEYHCFNPVVPLSPETTSETQRLIFLQEYWSALGSSANFPGHKMQDCLRVIHTDIVAVWNFYDPCQVNITP
ncbi:hypothetical protein M404DRAFT_125529, partial [Pisolithus tinctorius Marx 270]